MMINLNKKIAVLGLSVMLAGPVLASDDKVGEEIRQSAVAPMTTVAQVVAVEEPQPKYLSGKIFAKVFGNKAATAIGKSVFGIDYSKSSVEVDQRGKTVLSAFNQLSADEQTKIIQAIQARDLQSILKTGQQPVESMIPVAPTPPPVKEEDARPKADVKANNGGLLGQIQQGTTLRPIGIPQRPNFEESNSTKGSLAAAVASRRVAHQLSDDEGTDWNE